MTTVLIVEDQEDNRMIFTTILTRRGGLQVKSTEDVEEVLRIASAKEADLILMDIGLSQSIYRGTPVDGVEITQILKSNPTTANIPVILISAHAMESHRQQFLQASGADDYITKPILNQLEFVERVKKNLVNQPQQDD
jgi:two-component system cell cycle response regulator DivK